MTHKISGTVEEPSRLIVLDESDFSTLEYNDTVSGTYDVTVVSGSKTVIIRSADGESFGYGAVASKDDGVVENIGGIDADTFVMLHLDESPFIDSSLSPRTIVSEYGIERSDLQSKFGGYAAKYVPTSMCHVGFRDTSTNFWPSDFTLDFQLYLNTVNTSQMLVHHHYNTYNTAQLYLTGTGALAFTSRVSITWQISFTSDDYIVPITSWNHIALERYGNTYTIFLNGTPVATTENSYSPHYRDIKYLYFGNALDNSNNLDGYIDEARFSKVARYQGQSFTPPPIAYSVE